MKPFAEFPASAAREIRFVLTDVDDTLTYEGRLAPQTYAALGRLREGGLKVVPVTGASAGWCDLIAHMWPVDAVIGENGGFYFTREQASLRRSFWLSRIDLARCMARLRTEAAAIVAGTPEAATSWDQPYRQTSYAIEWPQISPADDTTARLLSAWREAGARCAVNSLWLLAWYGAFDKLAMARRMMNELFAIDLESERGAVLYVGDSANDEPMFDFFPHSIGVSTVRQFLPQLSHPPQWITSGPGGAGFVEMADTLLAMR
jgi:HAD superfamily hydrolase (TIGR01484 family)